MQETEEVTRKRLNSLRENTAKKEVSLIRLYLNLYNVENLLFESSQQAFSASGIGRKRRFYKNFFKIYVIYCHMLSDCGFCVYSEN